MIKGLTASLCAVWLLGSAGIAKAQTAGTIAGTVTDESGSVIPGSTITALNTDTGQARTAVSDAGGWYLLPSLTLGSYEVKAELSGFRTELKRGVQVTVGSEGTLNFTLHVGDLTDQVEVTGTISSVEVTRTGAIAGFVDDQQIRDLPLNGRSFTELAALQPGVFLAPTAVMSEGTNQGFGRKIVVNGTRPNFNSFLLDGADMNDGAGTVPGSAAGNVLGVESIREFTIITSNFSAEYGRAAGGVVNAVTKSGTNQLHGSVFEFFRSDHLDARNFFDIAKPAFTRNQFGFSLGGPILKNKTFFFGNYEGLRESLGTTGLARVPDALTRQGLIPVGGQRTQVAINPSVRQFLDLYPLPNGRDFGDGTAEYAISQTQPTREDFFVIKADHAISSSDSLSVRYNFDDADRTAPTAFGLFSSVVETGKQSLAVEEKRIFSSSLLSEVRFNVNKNHSAAFNEALSTIPADYAAVPGRPNFATYSVPGLTGFGNNAILPKILNLTNLELTNKLTWARGRHVIKTGMSWKRFHNDSDSTQNAAGGFIFASLATFLAGVPRSLEVMTPGADTVRNFRQNLFGFFVQDDVRLFPSLTINAGLRYEFITEPDEVNGKLATVRDIASDAGTTVGSPLFNNPSLKNFSPRLGFAWDPSDEADLVVRGGYGIFFDQLLPHFWYNFASRTPPFFARASITNGTFLAANWPIIREPIDAQGGFLDLVTWNPSNPYVSQFNLSVRKRLPGDADVTIAYVGTRGYNLFRASDANAPIPELSPEGRWFNPVNAAGQPIRGRRNPALGPMNYKNTESRSFYNGLNLSVQKRFARGYQFQASYAFSKSVDDSSNTIFSTELGGDIGIMQITDDPEADRGLSAWDTRHNLVVNASMELPFDSNAFVAGWQLNGIVRLTAGTPFTVQTGFDRARALPRQASAEGQRPDLAEGASNNPVLGGPDQYFDPLAFVLPPLGYFGNVGRNTLIGPGLATVDLSLVKDTRVARVSEGFNVEFRLEVFNLLNRPNFGLPSRTIFSSAGRLGGVGRISKTTTTARQVQLSLKVLF